MNIYFWNLHNQVFEVKSVPDWNGYETLVSTAKQVQDILNGGCKYSDYKNIYETLNRVADYYRNESTATGRLFYAENLEYAADIALSIYKYYATYPKYSERLKECLNTAIRGLVRGEVYDGDCNPSGYNSFYHIFEPQSDIHIYNGRAFYLWDGWHSDRGVMKELADKQFVE